MLDTTIYNKLCDYCAYSERCAADVRDKLRKLKVGTDEFSTYIEKLKDENFLNEERYVKAYVTAYSKKKWGKTKIRSALGGKRIDSALIKKYLDEVDEENYEEQIKVVAEKKWGSIKGASLRDRKTKLIRFLLSKGYEMNKVLVAIKEFS
jgi:regulatory protein